MHLSFWLIVILQVGRDNSVGIATGYGLDGLRIEFRWRRDFPHLSRPVLGPTKPPVQWVPDLSRGWRAAGTWRWPFTTFQCRLSWKSRAIPLLPLWAVRPVQSLSRAIPLLPLWTVRPVQSLSRAIPLLPLWTVRPLQSLSRAIPLLPLWTVRPVQSLSRAIPLLPLWTVRPVQSLSRAIPLLPLWTVRPVQSLSRAIPLLPLWTVRPVQSLSACTRVTFTFTFFFTFCKKGFQRIFCPFCRRLIAIFITLLAKVYSKRYAKVCLLLHL